MKYLIIITSLLTSFVYSQNFDLNFDFDKSELTPSQLKKLNSISEKIGSQKIELTGFTDQSGTDGYNKTLSKKRAKSVKEQLIQLGINENQIVKTEGKGKHNDLSLTDSEQRKVIIKIIESENANSHLNDEVSTESIDKMSIGEKFTIKNLEFIPGRHFITDDSKPELIKLLNVLKERPTLKIDIHGHVCCTTKSMDGFDIDTERNNLSKTRAKFVYDYLVEEGIEEDRLSYRGFGGTQPAYPETNDENRQKNRRVEIVLLEK